MKKLRLSILSLTIMVLLLSFSSAGCSEENMPANSQPEVRTVVDMAGREVIIPTVINKVFCVSPVGTILIYTLDPDLLVGWNFELGDHEKEYILPEYHNLPNLGGWYAKATCNTEELLKLHPDIIISAGYLDAEQIDSIQKQTGLSVVMVEGDTVAELDKAYEFVGRILNRENRANELAQYCRATAADVQAKAATISAAQKVKVYYAEGAAGLETDPRGSRHTETLDMVGGLNVAEVAMKGGMGMTAVSLEQVLSWDPDVILSWDADQGGYYESILTDPKWQGIAAVKEQRVYPIPNRPFNWFDRPPSVNRVIGLKWLGNLLYPELYGYDMAEETRSFYRLFYHYEISDQEISSLLGKAR